MIDNPDVLNNGIIQELTVKSIALLLLDVIKEAMIPFDDIAKEEARTFAKDMFIKTFMRNIYTMVESSNVYGGTFLDYLSSLPVILIDGRIFLIDEESGHTKNTTVGECLDTNSIKRIVESKLNEIKII